jgi:IclR family transcriptional regulator, acetate operon repressor
VSDTPAAVADAVEARCEHPKSVLGKASIILSAFGADHPRLTLAELVRRTSLPKSTAHRLAGLLVQEGWLDYVDGEYCIGLRLFELGGLVNDRHGLREVAMPFMQDLYEATHEIVHLAVLRAADVVYIDKIGGHRRMAVPSRIGGCMPAHSTGLGKAMLAHSGRPVISEVLAAGLPRRTPYTITSPNVLFSDLEVTARRGYAVDREESGLGIACAAAAIVCGGEVRGALSVTGPTYRIDPERLASAVRTAALGVGRVLSAQP